MDARKASQTRLRADVSKIIEPYTQVVPGGNHNRLRRRNRHNGMTQRDRKFSRTPRITKLQLQAQDIHLYARTHAPNHHILAGGTYVTFSPLTFAHGR